LLKLDDMPVIFLNIPIVAMKITGAAAKPPTQNITAMSPLMKYALEASSVTWAI